MNILTIDRSKWRRGGSMDYELRGPTRLLNEKGYMCCLGFDALACGLTPDDIRNAIDPETMHTRFANEGKVLPVGYAEKRVRDDGRLSLAAGSAVRANDDDLISEDQRELRVRDALLNLGWDDVVFVDGQ
jgi:hypothetical protein